MIGMILSIALSAAGSPSRYIEHCFDVVQDGERGGACFIELKDSHDWGSKILATPEVMELVREMELVDPHRQFISTSAELRDFQDHRVTGGYIYKMFDPLDTVRGVFVLQSWGEMALHDVGEHNSAIEGLGPDVSMIGLPTDPLASTVGGCASTIMEKMLAGAGTVASGTAAFTRNRYALAVAALVGGGVGVWSGGTSPSCDFEPPQATVYEIDPETGEVIDIHSGPGSNNGTSTGGTDPNDEDPNSGNNGGTNGTNGGVDPEDEADPNSGNNGGTGGTSGGADPNDDDGADTTAPVDPEIDPDVVPDDPDVSTPDPLAPVVCGGMPDIGPLGDHLGTLIPVEPDPISKLIDPLDVVMYSRVPRLLNGPSTQRPIDPLIRFSDQFPDIDMPMPPTIERPEIRPIDTLIDPPRHL